MIKKHSFLVLSFNFFFASAILAQTYIVKHNDTLSSISQQQFFAHRIYGANGMLNKIIALNPHIKNPHKIKPNQTILLPFLTDMADKPNSAISDQEQVLENAPSAASREIANDQGHTDAWTIKFLYGAKFLSLNQSETLPGFSLSSLSSDVLKIESEFKYNQYKFIGSLETYTFAYSSFQSTREEKLSVLKLNVIKNNFLLGLSVTEIPLLKASTTSLDFTKESQVGLMLGYDKTWDLKTEKPTSINLGSSITIPFKGSSGTTGTESSSLKGFEFKAEAEISRVIYKKENYSLKLIWQNELMYGQTSRQIKWSASNGQVKVKKAEARSLIGLGFSF